MDEDQRRDLLRRADYEARRASREHGRDSPQARAERQRQLGLERSTAAELGLPYAERVDLEVTWDAGTPVPVLLSGLRTFVAFYLSVGDPLSGGTNPRARDPQADHGIGVVEFKRMTSVKIGPPNDEAFRGHPLWGSGLDFYSAHEVKNSPWITELMDVDRAGTGGRPFDLETSHRVAEFKFTRWRGHDAVRQRELFADFVNLAEDESGKQRQLYVAGDFPRRFLETSRRQLVSVCERRPEVLKRITTIHGERFRTVREYALERGHRVKIIDLEAFLPAYIVAELEAASE